MDLYLRVTFEVIFLFRNFLVMFKALQFLRFRVYIKILLDFFVEHIRGRSELSTDLLDLTKKFPSKFFGYV